MTDTTAKKPAAKKPAAPKASLLGNVFLYLDANAVLAWASMCIKGLARPHGQIAFFRNVYQVTFATNLHLAVLQCIAGAR